MIIEVDTTLAPWRLWWLIFCRLDWAMGCWDSWINVNSRCVSRVLPENSRIWWAEKSRWADGPPQCGWVSTNPLRTKRWRKFEFSLSAWLSWNIHQLSSGLDICHSSPNVLPSTAMWDTSYPKFPLYRWKNTETESS